MSPPFQVKKVADEGSSSPFVARLFLGLLGFRDSLHLLAVEGQHREQMRDHFDRKFKPMFEAARASRDAAVDVGCLVATHLDAIEDGRALRFTGNQYDVLETIDIPLSQAVHKVLGQGIVATKTGLQEILRDPLGLDIGFLFQHDTQFNKGIADLWASGENHLAQYLQDVRSGWLSGFQKLRNQYEHDGWSLADVEYQLAGPSTVTVRLPTILSLPVDKYVGHTANRVLLFMENTMVYAMQRQCMQRQYRCPIFVAEIPNDQRDLANPQRFRLAARGLDRTPPWAIAYRDDMDFV